MMPFWKQLALGNSRLALNPKIPIKERLVPGFGDWIQHENRAAIPRSGPTGISGLNIKNPSVSVQIPENSRYQSNDKVFELFWLVGLWRSNGFIGLCMLCNAQWPGGKGAPLRDLQWNQLSDTECSQIKWNLRISTLTHSTVVLALKKAEWPKLLI